MNIAHAAYVLLPEIVLELNYINPERWLTIYYTVFMEIFSKFLIRC